MFMQCNNSHITPFLTVPIYIGNFLIGFMSNSIGFDILLIRFRIIHCAIPILLGSVQGIL